MNAGASLLALACLLAGVSIPWSAVSVAALAASAALALLPLVLGWRSKPTPAPPLSDEDSPGRTSRPIPIREPTVISTEHRIPVLLSTGMRRPAETLDESLGRAARVLRG